ncbi:N-acyl-phosphatidylethanolamine-hydrolyzing phospholipase D [Choanephora cucurbitarum]|uniref:N-acyl-phosphatidylethanolamine-hydrolyzing phospholipase D n=1 Tax=Choanephora cucurbitarum TaxID=101091 RepID=A0A1C7NMN9_9FUNG|nr:N-acyl-phosphatidylethanolamine-hydrolyzing phospholipase D [Choanephora cucurbitarum]
MPKLYQLFQNNSFFVGNKSDRHTLTVVTTAIALSSLLYLISRARQAKLSNSFETIRKKKITARSSLLKPQEKYASLKIGNVFVNPFKEWKEVPFYKTVLFWSRRWKGNGVPQDKKKLEAELPVVRPDFGQIKHASDAVTFTWFGQSTCLITIDGLTILSDPVFSKCSINDYLGPKRLRPIPCQLEDVIDQVDIVIVSHDHFDHLDEAAVHKLGNSVIWYVPLGLKSWFAKRGVHNVNEMDWWQEIRYEPVPEFKIACVPAMHWSGSRNPFEKNNTLWCSYVIEGKKNKVFFCGDTGYAPELFKAIGELYAPFTLAAIPIGSFMPTYLMQHLHMGPKDAIKVHFDLEKPRLSVGIHWATFMMSDEHYLAPRDDLNRLWNTLEPEETEGTAFTVTSFGRTVTIS